MFSVPEFKVGLMVVAISAVIAIMSIQVSEGPGVFGGKTFHFTTDNAAGLVKNSGVKMAGIKIGVIQDIELIDGEAKVTLALDGDAPVKPSSRIEIRTVGILGDKFVAITSGDETEPTLESGQAIPMTKTQGSLDDILGRVGKIADSVQRVVDNLRDATSGEGDKENVIGRIVLNIEKLTKDLAEVSSEQKDEVKAIIQSVNRITKTLDETLNNKEDGGFKAAWSDVRSSLRRLDAITEDIESVTQKVAKGEGTIGRLVNDEETVDELNTAIRGVNSFLGGVSKLQTEIDAHSEYSSIAEDSRTYISLRIRPGLDRYYELGIVDDIDGISTTTTTTSTIDGGTPTTLEESKNKDQLKFNAFFAKNFYNFTVRGGLLESTGGVAVDYHFYRPNVRLSLEAFDFENLEVRAYGRYNFYKGAYLIGGYERDESFSEQSNGYFVGAGLFLTNDDLRLFLAGFGAGNSVN